MNALDGISAQALSDTIGAIYDCALDPQRWPDALRRIAELCDSPLGSLGVQNLRNPEITNLYDYGYKPEFWLQYQKYVDLSPITPALSLVEVGGVLTLAMACSDEELFESRYYKELLKPHGYLDFIGVMGLRSSGRVAGVHVCRHEGAPRYGEREIGLLKLLSPHICRALAITDALDLRTGRRCFRRQRGDGANAYRPHPFQNGRVPPNRPTPVAAEFDAADAARLIEAAIGAIRRSRAVISRPTAARNCRRPCAVIRFDDDETFAFGHFRRRAGRGRLSDLIL